MGSPSVVLLYGYLSSLSESEYSRMVMDAKRWLVVEVGLVLTHGGDNALSAGARREWR